MRSSMRTNRTNRRALSCLLACSLPSFHLPSAFCMPCRRQSAADTQERSCYSHAPRCSVATLCPARSSRPKNAKPAQPTVMPASGCVWAEMARRRGACTHIVLVSAGVDLALCRVVYAPLELGGRHHGLHVSLAGLRAALTSMVCDATHGWRVFGEGRALR